MYFTDTKYYIFLFQFSLLFISSSVLHFMASLDTFLPSIICYRPNWFLMRSLYFSIVMKTQIYPEIIETHCVSIQPHSSQSSLYLWQIPYSLMFGPSEYCPTKSPVPCMDVQFLFLCYYSSFPVLKTLVTTPFSFFFNSLTPSDLIITQIKNASNTFLLNYSIQFL